MNPKSHRTWLINQSKKFAEKHLAKDKDYFANLNKGQSPTFLWLGCSDSRVDPSNILDTSPGDIFVIRNVANQAISHDPSFQAVLEYSVLHLKVKAIVVCGHSNCGGINAASSVFDKLEPNLQKALKHLKDDFLRFQKKNSDKKLEELQKMMYSENVRTQVANLMKIKIVKDAVEAKQTEIIPLLFRLDKGLL